MKLKKSVWLPTVIAAYFIIMAIYFGPEMIKAGRTLQFSLTCLAEVIVLVLLVIYLRKREKITHR